MLLAKLVERCFSNSAHLAPGREARGVPYLIVHGPRGPRWLVPRQANVAAARALHGWRPYDRAASLKWLAFRLAWHGGIAGGLPGIEPVSLIGIPERDAMLGPLAPPAIYVGTPDRRQKAVLFHGDPSGRRLAVEKVAIGADAADAIAQETRILRQLATLRPSLGPEVLRSDGDRLVTRWVDGSLIGPRLDETLLDLLASLRRENEIETTAEQRAAFSLPPRLPAFIEHGDLAPWNIRRAGGRLHLTDWEDGRIDGMPLQDLVGSSLAVRHLLAGQPPSEALRSERPVLDAFARRIGIEVATVPGLVMLYLTRRRHLALERGDAAYAAALLTAIETPPA